MTSSTEIGDDTIPPILTFHNVELLHHRLVVLEDTKSIKRLDYVLRCYSGLVRARRKANMRTDPVTQLVGNYEVRRTKKDNDELV